jgi:hypothetical protein
MVRPYIIVVDCRIHNTHSSDTITTRDEAEKALVLYRTKKLTTGCIENGEVLASLRIETRQY